MMRDLGIAAVGTLILIGIWSATTAETHGQMLVFVGVLAVILFKAAGPLARHVLIDAEGFDRTPPTAPVRTTAPVIPMFVVRISGEVVDEVDAVVADAESRARAVGAGQLVLKLPTDSFDWLAALEARGFDLVPDDDPTDDVVPVARLIR